MVSEIELTARLLKAAPAWILVGGALPLLLLAPVLDREREREFIVDQKGMGHFCSCAFLRLDLGMESSSELVTYPCRPLIRSLSLLLVMLQSEPQLMMTCEWLRVTRRERERGK